MYPQLLKIYGPLAINSYGFMIAVGLVLFICLVGRDPARASIISLSALYDVLFYGVVSGIVGGRLYFLFEDPTAFSARWTEVFYPWEGGFGVLGAILAILFAAPLILRRYQVPLLPFLDLMALYAPLLQSVSRVGCFLAGCCFGSVANVAIPWGVTYSNRSCLAPLGVVLHPTQLYASVASLIIFVLLYGIVARHVRRQGSVLFIYLMLESCARFTVDLWRGDRAFVYAWLSFAQLTAVTLFVLGVGGFVYIHTRRPEH